jgi:hypothetical protein
MAMLMPSVSGQSTGQPSTKNYRGEYISLALPDSERSTTNQGRQQ